MELSWVVCALKKCRASTRQLVIEYKYEPAFRITPSDALDPEIEAELQIEEKQLCARLVTTFTLQHRKNTE